VLKVLATSAGPEEREMFREGVTIMRRLRHPNVIEVIDAGELLDRRPWMAMVYLEAGSLQQHVDPTSALPADEVVFTGIRVAEVLAMLHAERLVHRDVKPANILRAADGEPVLTDLNTAGVLRPDRATLTTDRSTYAYAAPEVWSQGRYSVRAELYSLGVTLIELFTARYFTPQALEQLPRSGAFVDMPRDLVDLLLAMTAPDREARPDTAMEVAHRLRRVQHESDLPATSPTPPFVEAAAQGFAHVPTRGRNVPRRSALWMAGASLLAGTAAVTGLTPLWSGGAANPKTPPAFPAVPQAVTTEGMDEPWGIALSPDGNALYVADSLNQVVRRRDLTSADVSIVAGSGAAGPAGALRLGYPCGLAVRRDGAFYVSDSVGHRVYLVQPDGSVEVVAGTGAPGYSGDGDAAPNAHLNGPHGLAIAGNGDLFVADTDNNLVRSIDTDGRITSIAGSGRATGPAGDGGSARSAVVYAPEGLALTPDGSLLITQWKPGLVRRIDPDGQINSVAGTGTNGFSGDGGPALLADLNGPGGPSITGDGTVVFSDMNNNRVRTIGGDGTITTLAGSGQRGRSVDGVRAVDAAMANPICTAVAPNGIVYVLEWRNARVLAIHEGTIRTVLA